MEAMLLIGLKPYETSLCVILPLLTRLVVILLHNFEMSLYAHQFFSILLLLKIVFSIQYNLITVSLNFSKFF